jgi:hypothetical protein
VRSGGDFITSINQFGMLSGGSALPDSKFRMTSTGTTSNPNWPIVPVNVASNAESRNRDFVKDSYRPGTTASIPRAARGAHCGRQTTAIGARPPRSRDRWPRSLRS